MGIVYRARDVKLDQDIALKRIRPDRMSPERQQTLRREIILSRRVTHENVCRVYDLVELNGEEFVSMEFVPGRTLKEIETDERTLPLGLLSILGRAIAKDPASRFADADALADAIAAFEGEVLDRVLAEVSVTRSKMVKLMVILEANKSLAATFDPTETLRIILKTAT